MSPSDQSIERSATALEEALSFRERLLAGHWAGVRPEFALARLCQRWPELATPEPFAAARAALAGAAPPDRASLQRLAAGLAGWLAFSASAEPLARALGQRATAVVRFDLAELGLRDAERQALTCAERPRRASLWRAVAGGMEASDEALAEAVERSVEVWGRLGLAGDGMLALVGVDAAALAAQAEIMLRETRDACEDLLAYLYKRQRVAASPGDAARHDVAYALELTAQRDDFPSGGLWLAASQLVGGMELDPSGEGAIATDFEERSGRAAGARVALLRVPDEIALLLAPARTPADFARLFRAHGEALHWAGMDAELPASARTLADPALVAASGEMFESALFEPSWHRRALRLSSRAAGEAASLFALRGLVALRLEAARFLAARELFGRGPAPAVREIYRDLSSQAACADWGPVGWLDAEPASAAAALRGAALGALLRETMVQRFNEDWWRNPRAGAFLREHWRAGELGGALDLERCAKALVERAAR